MNPKKPIKYLIPEPKPLMLDGETTPYEITPCKKPKPSTPKPEKPKLKS